MTEAEIEWMIKREPYVERLINECGSVGAWDAFWAWRRANPRPARADDPTLDPSEPSCPHHGDSYIASRCIICGHEVEI